MIRSFEHYASAFPERTAIIHSDGTTLTFGEVAVASALVSRLLEQVGTEAGDVVCALLPNGPDMLVMQRGVLQMPVYLSTINWHLAPPEIAHILQDSKVRLFFTDSSQLEKAEHAFQLVGVPLEKLVIIDADPEDPRSLAARVRDLPPGRPDGISAGTRRLYTSGTTGKPKAVLRPLPGVAPHVYAQANIERAALYGVDHEEGTYLSVAPMYHAAPLAYADQALDLGHTVVILPKWDAKLALEAIRRHRVTWSYMVPLMFQELLARPAAEHEGVDSLRALVHTAAPCPPHVKRAMIEWVGPILTEIYGGTEGSATVIRSEDWLTHPGSVGRARPGATIEIRDDEGRVLGPRDIGHIYFENRGLGFVYANDAEKTASSRIGNSVTLGDIGYIDEEGFLYLCDRLADIVISGGVNIYPAEIEHALKECTWVADACVVGVPDERWGEALLAVVVTTGGPVDEEERSEALTEHLRVRIAGFKVPRLFQYADALPYSEAGKLLRRTVRETWGGHVIGPDA
jgi:long-chain acyl-CoA synthetase